MSLQPIQTYVGGQWKYVGDPRVRGIQDEVGGRLSSNSLAETFSPRERAAEPLPLRDVTLTGRGSNPIPAEFFGGYLWGVDTGGVVKRSDNGGQSWTTHATVPNVETDAKDISRILPTSDGEVLVVSASLVQRSTGWESGAPTWATVLTNPTPSYFYPWGIDGDGDKFIIVHYSGSGVQTPDRADSRYGWISTDGGHTWNIRWDVVDRFGEALNEQTHTHAAAYDPWEDRFLIAEGHEEATGVYVSTDDGATWDRLPYGDSFDSEPGNAPTVIKPTDFGVVFGSDDPTNGVMVLPRGTSTIERAYSRMGVSNTTLFGYAHMGARDPRTGLVYLVWELNQANAGDLPPIITGSDGQVGGLVWEGTDPGQYLWRRVAIDDAGNLLAWEQATDTLLRAKVGYGGARPVADRGRVLGGRVVGGRGAVAVGAEALANGIRTVAIGKAIATDNDAFAAGDEASATGASVAIGSRAIAEAAGTAVGYGAVSRNGSAFGQDAQAVHATTVALGRGARAVTDDGSTVIYATAVGRDAKASGPSGNATALGYSAEASDSRATALGSVAIASGDASIAVGYDSEANALRSIAVGREAVAGHNYSIALGYQSVTTATDQVMVGGRDVEITDPIRGVILRSPDGTRWRVTVGDDGTLSTTSA